MLVEDLPETQEWVLRIASRKHCAQPKLAPLQVRPTVVRYGRDEVINLLPCHLRRTSGGLLADRLQCARLTLQWQHHDRDGGVTVRGL